MNLIQKISFALTAVLLLSACRKESSQKAIVLDCGDYTASKTLSNHNEAGYDYIVECDLHFKAGTLSIEPGTSILFKAGAALYIEDNANIQALGKAGEKIVFEGESSSTSTWKGLAIFSSGANKLLYLDIKGGGSAKLSYALCEQAALMVTGRLDMQYCSVDRSGDIGIYIGECITTPAVQIDAFAHNTIRNANSYGLKTQDLYLKFFDFSSCTFSGNAQEFIAFKNHNSNNSIEGQHVWNEAPVPYLSLNGFYITGSNSNLRLNPGLTIKMASNTWCGTDGAASLRAEGTAAKPIRIEGLSAVAGYWRGMIFEYNTDNLLRHVILADGGGGDAPAFYASTKANVYVGTYNEGRLTLDFVTSLRSNSNCDVAYLREKPASVNINNSSLNTCES